MEFRRIKIFIVVGYIASGKGRVGEIIAKEEGAAYMKFSDILRDILTSENIEINRDTLTKEGNGLREAGGSQILAELTYFRAIQKGYQVVVIDGPRHIDEIRYLKHVSDVYVVAVKAPYDLSLDWYYKRAEERKEDYPSREAFDKQLAIERSTDTFGQNIQECIDEADYVINNEGSLDDLNNEVKLVLESIRNKTTVEGAQKSSPENPDPQSNEGDDTETPPKGKER